MGLFEIRVRAVSRIDLQNMDGSSDRPAKHGRQPISMAGKTSKASTQPPGEALSPKHEAFVQAYVSPGMNGTKAYRAVYPSIKSDDVAGAAAARLLGNVRVQARIAEIMRAGAERAEVTVEQVVRELKLLGFSDIRKVVSWRNELVTRTEKGEDGEPVMVLMPQPAKAFRRIGKPVSSSSSDSDTAIGTSASARQLSRVASE
jgi:Terminase small subunit